jgi:tRNA pseudouridine55 synthase
MTVSPCGVIVVDKPRGPTSHDVVSRARRLLKTRHVGHAGTLDPMATGVLVLAVGEATKLVPWLTASDKRYEATIRLGIETDSLDANGEVRQRVPVPDAVLRAMADAGAATTTLSPTIEAALRGERARALQVPPAFSAIRIDGERAHALAREGRLEDADLAPRPVEVRHLLVVRASITPDPELGVDVAVSKGYFVRSLARDLARALGTVGHLTALRRTRAGAFGLEDAVPLEAVARDRLLALDVAASRALPVTRLDPAGVRAVSFGQRVAAEQMIDPHPGPSAWVDAASAELVAIGECTPDGTGRVIRGFVRRP